MRNYSIHHRTKLTIPFNSPHFIRSRTRPCVSQRAEKFTTAHLFIFVGCANFYRSRWNSENSNMKNPSIKIFTCRDTKYLVVEVPSSIPRKEILPIPHFQLLRKREQIWYYMVTIMIKIIPNVFKKWKSSLQGCGYKREKKKSQLHYENKKIYPWCWQNTTFHLREAGTNWNAAWT